MRRFALRRLISAVQPSIVLRLGVLLSGWLPPGTSWAADQATAPGADRPTQLEDQPEALAPKQPRTEEERDHLTALALFSAGRIANQRQDFAAALRPYQRALRYST